MENRGVDPPGAVVVPEVVVRIVGRLRGHMHLLGHTHQERLQSASKMPRALDIRARGRLGQTAWLLRS